MKPYFSIITVTKDTEKKIDLTIRSVLSQSFKNFEYLIVDGNSTDSTFDKINRYKKNKNIKIYRRSDKNFYESLNYATSKAKGNYISIINSGDIYFSSNVLMNINNGIKRNQNVHFYFSNLIYFTEKKKVKRIWDRIILKNTLLDAFMIAHPTIFLKRKIARKFKYDDNYKISADLDLILSLIKNNITYKYLNIFTIAMATGGMSTSHINIIQKLREDLKVYKKYFKNYILLFFFQKFCKLKSLRLFHDKYFSRQIERNINYLNL
jgi:glycosyltransferase